MNFKLSMGNAAIWATTGMLVLTSAAHAQWTVTNLYPPGATKHSRAYAASGGQQAGVAVFGIGTSRYEAAGLWSGTADSWVDLHPVGAGSSEALAVSDVQQAGWANVGGEYRASLWRGTAASWVDLNPAGATRSYAFAISGGQQVGYAKVSGQWRASLWSGTAASWVDLHPAGAADSKANAVSSGQQAGYAFVSGVHRACLWSGTAASWVDLNPLGASWSEAYAASGGKQAGYATVGGVDRASLWSGTAASWVDLHAFLPAVFRNSYARGISTDGINNYVTGWGYNTLTEREEPLLWTQPVPELDTLTALGLGALVLMRRRRRKR